ncbi:MAG TPA: ABC transporter substrate-binding protein [Cellulomonas sp.]
MHRATRLSALTVIAVTALTACSSGSDDATSSTSSGSSDELTTVSLRLDWTWGAEHTGYVVADQLGYYADEGLDVQISEGEGSTVTATLVANGDADLGVVSAGEVLSAVSTDMPLQAVATVVQSSPTAIIYDEAAFDTAPTSLEDLYGHSLGVVTDSSTYKEWQALASLDGIDTSQIQEVAVGDAVVQSILTGQVDAIVGWTFNQGLQVQTEGGDVGFLKFGDLGLDIPNSTIAANTDLIASDPDLVSAFVRATAKGWEYTREHQDEALAMLFDAQPEIDVDYNTAKLPLVLELMGEADDFGAFDAESWQRLKDLYDEQGLLDSDVTLDGQVYTTDLLG